MFRRHKRTIKFIIGCALSLFFLYLAFKNVELRKLWQVFKEINYLWTIPVALITLLGMYIRAVRWRWIFKSRYEFSSKELFPPLIIGFALNSLLPLRAGEFARPFVLSRKKKIPYTTSLATVLVERIVDGVTLLFSFFVTLLFVRIDPEISVPLKMGNWNYIITGEMLRKANHSFAIFIFIMLIGSLTLIIGPIRAFYEKIISGMSFVKESYRSKLIHLLHSFSEGFDSLKDFKNISMIAIYSAIIWAMVGFSLQVMSWGFPDLSLNFFHGMAVMIIICFAIMLPAAPGYWGLYECGTIFALIALGLVKSQGGNETALGFSLVIHFLQTLPIILMGLFYLWKENISLKQLEEIREND